MVIPQSCCILDPPGELFKPHSVRAYPRPIKIERLQMVSRHQYFFKEPLQMRLLYRRVWEPLSGFPCSPLEALFNLLVLKLCLISQWESESRTPILSLYEPVNQTPRLISNWEAGTASELRATGDREVSLGFGEHRAALPKLGDQQGHRNRDLNIRYNWPVLGPLEISKFFHCRTSQTLSVGV